MLIASYINQLPERTKNCLVQVGAHEGHEASLFDEIGFRRIAWIEADPTIFESLSNHISRFPSQVHSAHNALISASSGKEYNFYHYSNDGASNSIYKPTNLFKETFAEIEVSSESLTLISTSLDDFCKNNNLVPSVLVIDVQGAELEVLSGASKALEFVLAVEIEISRQEIYSGGAIFSDVNIAIRKSWLCSS